MLLSLVIDAQPALPVSAHMAVYASHNLLDRVTRRADTYTSVTITFAEVWDVQLKEKMPIISKYMPNNHLHKTEKHCIMFLNAVQRAQDKLINLFHLCNIFFLRKRKVMGFREALNHTLLH